MQGLVHPRGARGNVGTPTRVCLRKAEPGNVEASTCYTPLHGGNQGAGLTNVVVPGAMQPGSRAAWIPEYRQR